MLAFWRIRTQRLHRGSVYLNMNIDPVEQGSRYFSPVPLNYIRTTQTVSLWVAMVSTGTRIHRSNELKSGGKISLAICSRDRDSPTLHGFSQDFENVPIKFRELIQEQHAVVSA